MLLSKGISICLEYHKSASRVNTVKAYEFIFKKMEEQFHDRDLYSISSDEMLNFLNHLCEGTKQRTKRSRYSHARAFFNFIRNNIDQDFKNPCDTAMFKRTFKQPEMNQWDILDKEIVDEVIFRTTHPRNRLMLELMARGGMRISEVLGLTPDDVQDQKLVLRSPKSGKQKEYVYIPQKLSEKLKEYIESKNISSHNRIFPITYVGARCMVHKAGLLVDKNIRPHDLRRHAATFASRSGVPIEIVSKVILRHTNLSTTQRYLGKITDKEASRWIDGLYC